MLVAILGAVVLAACTQGGETTDTSLEMADLSLMPAEVQTAPVSVQQSYQFAFSNPDVLQHIPCYCGCGSMGHTSNYSCYVSGMDEAGNPIYDSHALGCSICIDITLDTMRLLEEGKTVSEIRSYVDTNYTRYGPSNMP